MRMDDKVGLYWKGLVQGKLDQKTRSIRVTYVVARDVQSHDIVSMKDKLKEWYDMARRFVLYRQYA